MLSSEQIDLVQTSFKAGKKSGEALVAEFYSRLFEAAPQVRHMFSDDVSTQTKKLYTTLNMAVNSLRKPDDLIQPLKDLGKGHDEMGVKPEHYTVVANTLIATLKDSVPDIWTDAHEEAWQATLTFVATTMLEGAEEKETAS